MNRNKTLLKWLYITCLSFLFACNNNQQSKEVGSSKVSVDKKVNTNLVVARGDSIINLAFSATDTSLVVSGKLDRVDQHITVHVTIETATKLTATLTSSDTSLHNIRFSQVIYPNSQSEGPFGKTISISTKQNGNYQLIISHNLMAEGGLVKEFQLHVSVTR